MRRSRVLTSLIAVASLAPTGVLLVGTAGAQADTANPEIATESWFARFKPEDPQVDVPCIPNTGTTTVPPQGCGPLSPGDSPAPQSKSTGHYVVSHRGGDVGDDDSTGDTGWAAFQWDLSSQFGATADKFVVTLHLGMDNCDSTGTRCLNWGDTYQGVSGQTPPPIQACNILEPWSGEPGSNPWGARPTDSVSCVPGTANGREYTFDVSTFADSWLDGSGHGMVLRPGTPTTRTTGPFQVTFAGYYDTGPAPKPKVTFAYTPAVEDDFFNDDFEDFGGGGEEFFEDITTDGGSFEAMPDLDIIPTDVGSDLVEPTAEAEISDEVTAAPLTRRRTAPISSKPGFPWMALLLLPLAAIAFWGTGTALGPIGDPVPARLGGVSRVLTERQAAHRGSDIDTRI